MKKLNLSKYLVTPLALVALIGFSDAALAHDQDKREHRHPDKEYSTKYRHLDDNPKYHPIKKYSHKPYGLVTVRKQHANWRGRGHAYGHNKHHGKGHHHKPVKYVYVPAYGYDHHRHGHDRSGYSIKYFGDNFSIGLRNCH